MPMLPTMDVLPARQRQRLRWPLLLALILALAGLAVRYTVVAGGARGASVQARSGITGQETSFELGVREQRVLWLRTSLSAACAGGPSWRASWSPAEGDPVHFTAEGRSFVTQQEVSTHYSGGIVGRIGFVIRGTLIGQASAQGTMRLVARFYRGERQWNACDSLDVRWAVGPRASLRLPKVPVGHQIGEYYPAVPSLASNVSRARRRFISLVDGVCVGTYNEAGEAQAEAARQYRYLDDHVLLDSAVYVLLHTWQLRSLVSLGQPPQAHGLYDAWLANFRDRVSLERQVVTLYAHNHAAAARRTAAALTGLKAQGNLLGQRFGLVRCTSNGDRTAIPILSNGEPSPLP
jgi:hypothetical protein